MATAMLDMAVVNQCGNTGGCNGGSVSILTGNGDGTFTLASSPTVGFVPEYLAVGDFNHDGILDLAVVNNGDDSGPGTVSILLGNGDGTFAQAPQSPISITSGYCLNSIAAGDLNGDGNLDLALTDTCNRVALSTSCSATATAHSTPARRLCP